MQCIAIEAVQGSHFFTASLDNRNRPESSMTYAILKASCDTIYLHFSLTCRYSAFRHPLPLEVLP